MYRRYLTSRNHVSDGEREWEWGLFIDHDDNDTRSIYENPSICNYYKEGDDNETEFECDFMGSILFIATIGFISCLYN